MSQPTPSFDCCASTNGPFLSRMIIAVRCRHCREMAPVDGSFDETLLLWRHRGHLGDVAVDLLVRELGTDQISIMRLRLLPLEMQMFGIN